MASKVRIAHFDTGYDPDHHTLPKRLRRELARNFVDDDHPNDASDQTSGLLTNLGHGTGTLSILAGTALPGQSLLGGAPFAEIVPVRVANRVVLFSNSSIAQAFDYVHGLNAAGTNRVDIITMSMGGLASQAWADAVNALYEQGVFIVTAAGNNFGNLPTHNIVYPARFNRVVAACGVMANGKPYADLGIRLMAGNYGPDGKMATAIAAPTPNVPWARLGCSDIVDFDGAGTSAATPQVAAAAAIWLQKNRAAVDAYPQGWMRVEAIRKALFEQRQAQSQHGDQAPRTRRIARQRGACEDRRPRRRRCTRPRRIRFRFRSSQILTGLGMQAAAGPQQRMLELEALQLSQSAAIESRHAGRSGQRVAGRPAPACRGTGRRPAGLEGAARGAGERRCAGSRSAFRGARRAGCNAHRAAAPRCMRPIRACREPAYRPLRVYAYDPSLGAQARYARHQRGHPRGPLGRQPQAGPDRRIYRGDRRRSGEPVLLCAGRPQPSVIS